ncbi:MAG: hypothetical protein IKC24_02540 [Oscillospiraceae bacterium]|nr:hypothetical protein [Oscillospiraceae bacterium]
MAISTFGSFTQARLGIYASQAGLSVTGNNISNINTDGYTRQKLQQTSFYAGGSDRYYSTYDIRVGNGVLATSVSQMRDPYLDIRYRSEMASVGANDAKLAGLQQVQNVLDEVGDGEDGFGILSHHFSDLLSKLHQLSDQTGLAEYDIQVRSSAETLAKQFNSYASQLKEIYDNGMTSFKQDVEAVNNILDGIRSLNSTIRKAEIHGDNALELRDQRNMLIDQLSAYVKIDVHYEMEEISGGLKVEKLTINLGDANPQNDAANTDRTTLIDGVYGRNFEIADETSLDMALTALVDSKDRVLNTIEKKSVDYPISETPLLSSSNTDANGVTTIVTYEMLGMVPKQNPAAENDPNALPYLKEDNTPTADKNEAQQLIAYKETTYTQTPSTEVQLLDNDLYGSLQAQREFLTEEGEFSSAADLALDPNAGTKRGVVFYQRALDLLANHFAKVFNDANQGYYHNSGGNYADKAGNEITVSVNGVEQPISMANGLTAEQEQAIIADNSDAAFIIKDEQGNATGVNLDAYLAEKGSKAGGPMFSIRGDTDAHEGITAANISISKSWAGGPQIVGSFLSEKGIGVASTDSSNINHMIVQMTEKMNYDPTTVVDDAASNSMFNGDFQEMWVNMGTLLGNDVHSTSTVLDTYYASSVEIDTSRSSVSSVDLNDEAMNLMQYSQSYNAACRLMTTLDSMLDKLINGTGVLT